MSPFKVIHALVVAKNNGFPFFRKCPPPLDMPLSSLPGVGFRASSLDIVCCSFKCCTCSSKCLVGHSLLWHLAVHKDVGVYPHALTITCSNVEETTTQESGPPCWKGHGSRTAGSSHANQPDHVLMPFRFLLCGLPFLSSQRPCSWQYTF